MIGSVHLGDALHITAAIGPIALYFLVLGLLNSRRRPQLLTGRQDFCLLAGALGPLFVLPLMNVFGASVGGVAASVAVVAAAALLLAPRGASWVVYNARRERVEELLVDALDARGLATSDAGGTGDLRVGDGGARLRFGSFPVLDNVTIRLDGADTALARRVGEALSTALGCEETDASPSAVGFLLAATAMLVAPLALFAQRVPEIVRLLSDLLR